MKGWISTEDRLPDDCDDCIFISLDYHLCGPAVCYGFYNNDLGCWFDCDRWHDEPVKCTQVTLWMPLQQAKP